MDRLYNLKLLNFPSTWIISGGYFSAPPTIDYLPHSALAARSAQQLVAMAYHARPRVHALDFKLGFGADTAYFARTLVEAKYPVRLNGHRGLWVRSLRDVSRLMW